MPSSPTPSERERLDAEARVREEEEQAKLPYKWTQTIKDLDIVVPVAGNLRGKDIEVVMTKTKLKVAVKGQTPAIDVRLLLRVAPAHIKEISPSLRRDMLRNFLANGSVYRVILLMLSKSTSQPGRWRQLVEVERRLRYTLTRPIKWNGGMLW